MNGVVELLAEAFLATFFKAAPRCCDNSVGVTAIGCSGDLWCNWGSFFGSCHLQEIAADKASGVRVELQGSNLQRLTGWVPGPK
jgi:hypothetical protein